jgi:DNA-binding FadR family transcriptional regulator
MRRSKGRSLHDYVVQRLGRNIVNGTYPVGRPIPSETDLCLTLEISRTALREALVSLSSKGLLQARQKVGTIVRPREDWNMLDFDVLTWRVASEERGFVVGELYELRKLIEPLAAALAAENAARRDIDRITLAYNDMAAAGDDGTKVLDPDVRFHRAIIAATGNSLFASVGLIIATALEVNFEAVKDSPRGHVWALPLHKSVLDAIEAGDPKAARVAMMELLTASEADLRSFTARSKNRRRVGHRGER